MSVVSNNILAGASGQGGAGGGGYAIERSLRFNSGDSSYLSRQPSSAGNRKTWTWSGWVKRGAIGSSDPTLFSAGDASLNVDLIRFNTANQLDVLSAIGSINWRYTSSAVYRDPGAWLHCVVAVDTTNSTAADRVKIYVNGVRLDSFSSETAPSSNYDNLVNSSISHAIGYDDGNNSYYLDGYLADVHFIDGQALAATDFGAPDDNGVWQPKKFDGSYTAPGTALASATGALPVLNTTGDYGGTVVSGVRSDSNASSLTLCMPLTSQGGLSITDDVSPAGRTAAAKTVTNSGATADTSSYKYYGGSTQFDVSQSDRMSIAGSSDFAFGTGPFTVEFWYYNNNDQTGTDYNNAIGNIVNPTAGYWRIGTEFGNTGEVYFSSTTGSYADIRTGVNCNDGKWHHIAVVREGTGSNQFKIYIDGDQKVAGTVATNLTSTATLYLMYSAQSGTPNHYSAGSLQDVRIYKGVAKYTGNFTVPAAPPSVCNSFHLDFADNSSNAALGTDTSGVSPANTWTVNNLSAGAGDYSISGGSNYLNREPADMFDGSTSTYWQAAASGVRYQLMTFPTPKTGTTIELSVLASTGWDGFEINGTVPSSLPSTGSQSWYDISSHTSGSLSSIRIAYTSGLNTQLVYALRIDGTIVTGQTEIDASSNDSLVDTPTNGDTASDTGLGAQITGNYATLNPLQTGSNTSLTNGNLDFSNTATEWNTCLSSIFVSSGKWYCETVVSNAAASTLGWGVAKNSHGTDTYLGGTADGWALFGSTSTSYTYTNGSNVNSSYCTLADNDVLGMALDMDAGTLTYYVNNVSQGTAFSGITGPVCFAVTAYPSGATSVFNFGQRAFAYTAPSGYKSLNTANLPTPTIADGSQYFDTKLYTGNNGTAQTISGLNFSPDFIWYKHRNGASSHGLHDIVRGAGEYLSSNSAGAELSLSTVTAFNSDGFSLGTDGGANGSGTFVAWAWDAGTSTVTNNDGSIASQVRAQPSAGCSIVSWTGTGANGTIGHGLGAQPEFIIIKNRSSSLDWLVGHVGITLGSGRLLLNSTDPNSNAGASSYWNNTAGTSSVFSIGSHSVPNESGSNIIAYCFAPVAGYSAMGKYTANTTAGSYPFIYTGFKPRWIMFKNISASWGWYIHDTARSVDNPASEHLIANATNAESNYSIVDILSNGFKLTTVSEQWNYSTNEYIYIAFAENPFQANGGLAR